MNNYYSGVILLTILLMTLLLSITRKNPIIPKQKKLQFDIGYCVVILGAVCEWGAKYLEVSSSIVWLHTLVKTFELVVAPAIPLFLLPGISDGRSKLSTPMFVIFLVNGCLEVLSAFLGFIFYVDASNVYHHGPFYWIYIASYLLECILLLWGVIDVVRKYPNSRVTAIIAIVLFLFVGIALQNIDSSIKVDYITIAVTLLLFYVVYADILQSVDSLTRLSNRHTYDSAIGRLSDESIIVNIDVDYFKQCNDRFGHLYGDKCLRIIGSVIMNSFNKYGDCYRIGGDEFCVIINEKVTDIDMLLSEFHEAMGVKRMTEPGLPFVSTGYAFFTPGSVSVNATIEKADAMMYQFKNLRKQLWEAGKNPTYLELARSLHSN